MTDTLRDRVTAALGDIYEIGREVGRGGMGVVFGATDRKLRRGVAIKVLPPEMTYREDIKIRFLREAQTAAGLSHPNIVPIYSVEERQGIVCFIMALVSGESVGSAITRQGAMPIPEVVSILSDVADALGYAHARGIVHRDIKPDNILIDETTRRALVTDFGIARAAEGDARLTLTGVAVGTPAYMSPEQAIGDQEIDGRSDIYSLAIVGYQMLTGTLPFKATNTPAMLMKHLQDIPQPIGELRIDAPRSLINALERAMSKKPQERHESAAAFKLALTSASQAPAPRREPTTPARRPPERSAVSAADNAVPRAWQHKAAPRIDRPPGPARLPRLRPENARSAIEAADAGWRSGALSRNAGRDHIPEFMPSSWKDTRADWDRSAGRSLRRGGDQGSVDDRIRSLRKRFARSAITVAMLATVNLVFSPGFLWFFFPMIGMAIGLMHRMGSLWADGVKVKDVFGRGVSERLAASVPSRPQRSLPRADEGTELAPAEVIAGPHGEVVRRATADRRSILDAVARLTDADRQMIPDVVPTVKALAERVGSLAVALHHLDADVRPGALESLDARLTAARSEPEGSGRDHRIQLLDRQRATLVGLASRRSTLTTQLDGAALLLQNMRLDLAALQSAGVQSVLNDVSGATQEARALSREIAHVLEAAREVR